MIHSEEGYNDKETSYFTIGCNDGFLTCFIWMQWSPAEKTVVAANKFYEDSTTPKYMTILNGSSHGTFIFEEEP